MKLTRRQEEFITKLIDLSQEFDGPIHYSVLAERLGVSPFTAYDMLCLLEEKGLVTSEYQLAADKNGPGRTERLFFPKQSIEERKELLAEEVLARVPEIEHGEISYCVEIMTIAALRLRSSSGRKLLLDHLPKILPASHTTPEDLSLLGGFTFGLLAHECHEDDEWVQILFVYIQQYLRIVLRLTPQECKQLARALSEVFVRFTEERYDGS